MFALSRALLANTPTVGSAGIIGDILGELMRWLEDISRSDPSPHNRDAAAYLLKMTNAAANPHGRLLLPGH